MTHLFFDILTNVFQVTVNKDVYADVMAYCTDEKGSEYNEKNRDVDWTNQNKNATNANNIDSCSNNNINDNDKKIIEQTAQPLNEKRLREYDSYSAARQSFIRKSILR